MQLTIDLIGKAAEKTETTEQTEPAAEPVQTMILNLADYF